MLFQRNKKTFLIASPIVNIPKIQLPPPKPPPIAIRSIITLTGHNKEALMAVDKLGAKFVLKKGTTLIKIKNIDKRVLRGINLLKKASQGTRIL